MRGRCCQYERRFIQGEINLDAATGHTGSVKLSSCHNRRKLEEKRVEDLLCSTIVYDKTPQTRREESHAQIFQKRLNESTNGTVRQPTKGASDAH